MTKDEMKNRISMALKDSILQQGFECICKENAELKERNRGLLESCEGATMMYKDLCKAKELLNEFVRISKASDEDFEYDYSELIGETKTFLKR